MGEQPDHESQTEEPTAKKLADAVEQGNLPVSREVTIFFSMLGLTIVNAFTFRDSLVSLAIQLRYIINNLDQIPLGNQLEASNLFHLILFESGTTILPIIAPLLCGGLVANIAQTKFHIIGKRIQPDFSRISISAGWNKLFGLKNLVEFSKNFAKLTTISILLFIVLKDNQDKLVSAMFYDPSLLPELVLNLSMRLLSVICIVTLVLATLDFLWVKNQWRRDLRMSKQEIKEEFKQIEGDPFVKAKVRSIMLDRVRKSMIASVPKATVVITNPTHFAVALRYLREEGGTPIVIAKGTDLIALKIREIADAHEIPIVENRPLARALYDKVGVNDAIPAEFYRAIAEIIHYLNTRRTPNVSSR